MGCSPAIIGHYLLVCITYKAVCQVYRRGTKSKLCKIHKCVYSGSDIGQSEIKSFCGYGSDIE